MSSAHDIFPIRRLGTWAATAMVVNQVVGVGIFLTPATMMRSLGNLWAVLGLWLAMGVLGFCGALCYAELATRFPYAGGGYVYLREAFGRRWAFVYGWMSLLVVDPGLTAALAYGLARYVIVAFGYPSRLLVPVAIACLVGFGGLTLAGIGFGARVLRWTATAKLIIVAVLVCAGVVRAAGGVAHGPVVTWLPDSLGPSGIGAATIAAFFAFGGWWELGKMSEEVTAQHRTIPRALLGGISLIAIIYSVISVAFILVASGAGADTDEEFVSAVGAALFGGLGGRLLAAMVVVAVSGTLASVLLAAPRLYLAMARDGVLPETLARFNERRGTSVPATLVQVSLACVLLLLGTFDAILGFFIPMVVFFLALSASALLVLPRPDAGQQVFRAPLHPLPIVLFLSLVGAILAVSAVSRPVETLIAAAVLACGVPVARSVVPSVAGVRPVERLDSFPSIRGQGL